MTNLLKQANQHYENDQFTEARELYRQAFLQNPPSSRQLDFLETSERYEKLLYLKQLRTLYTDSKVLIEEEAFYFMKLGMKPQAFSLWEQLFDEDNLPERDLRRLHTRRFHANIRFFRPDFDILFEDFSFLYNLETSYLNSKFITRVINDLNSIEAIPFLKKLQSQFTKVGSDLYTLIHLKVSYIEQSDKILKQP